MATSATPLPASLHSSMKHNCPPACQAQSFLRFPRESIGTGPHRCAFCNELVFNVLKLVSVLAPVDETVDVVPAHTSYLPYVSADAQ